MSLGTGDVLGGGFDVPPLLGEDAGLPCAGGVLVGSSFFAQDVTNVRHRSMAITKANTFLPFFISYISPFNYPIAGVNASVSTR